MKYTKGLREPWQVSGIDPTVLAADNPNDSKAIKDDTKELNNAFGQKNKFKTIE